MKAPLTLFTISVLWLGNWRWFNLRSYYFYWLYFGWRKRKIVSRELKYINEWYTLRSVSEFLIRSLLYYQSFAWSWCLFLKYQHPGCSFLVITEVCEILSTSRVFRNPGTLWQRFKLWLKNRFERHAWLTSHKIPITLTIQSRFI